MKKLLEKIELESSINTEVPFSLVVPFFDKVKQKETGHSEIIRSLLDPEENHNHENEFLDLFLDKIKLKYKSNQLTNINVETERGTKVKDNNSRPIDILITYEYFQVKCAIIIENKLNYAPDQVNQLNDYHDGLFEEGYKIEKMVYIHVDPGKTFKSTDTRDDLYDKTIDYNALDLISTLEKMKHYSYIVEYQNLLKNISYNYLSLIESQKIQKDLNDEELEKIVEISKVVNSDGWNEAKYFQILEKLNIDKLKSTFNKKYATYYVENYKFWVEVWFYPLENKVYICSTNEKDSILVDGVEYKKWGDFKDRWFYEKDKNVFNFPSDNNELVNELRVVLNNSKIES